MTDQEFAPERPELNQPEPPSPATETKASADPTAATQEPQRQTSQREPQRQGRDQRSGRPRPQRGRERPKGEQQPPSHHREGGSKELSIVIPLYNEEQSLRELYEKIRNAVGRMGRYEVIFVDDGSTDGSSRVLQDIRNRDRGRVKIIRFRRNYGKSAALSVGFQYAEGNIVVTMDADLQDDPQEIPGLMNEIKKGFDLVSGWKKKRRDPITKTIPSKFFNFVTSMMTGIRLHDFNCGLKAYRKELAKELKIYGELHRYLPVLAHNMGYKVGELPVHHHPRKYGKTKFGIGRFWRGFLDLVSVLFTTRYMQRPLHLFGFVGSLSFLLGLGVDLYLTYLKFTEGIPLGNRPLFLGGVLLIIVGIQLISLGLLGEMISKTRGNEREYSIREVWK